MVRAYIEEFLRQKRLAVVGVSRKPKDFSRGMLAAFRRRGYDAVAVSPQARELDGQPCFARVQDIEPPVTAALLMTRLELTDQLVRECAAAGIKRVWVYGISGRGAVSPALTEFCAKEAIELVPGFCPHMFFAQAGFFHRLHACFMKLLGSYPA